MTTRLGKLFEHYFGESPLDIIPLRSHASYRKIYRLKSATHTAVGVLHDSYGENQAFVEFGKHFKKFGLPVPEIYGEDLAHGAYLQEDLGDETLFDVVSKEEIAGDIFSDRVEDLYKKAITILPRFQIEAGRTLDYSLCYPSQEYDRANMLWDMRYFRDSFLERADLSYVGAKLERDFEIFATFLASAPRTYFLHRDFQARNIMVLGTELSIIDFQSGRRGPLYYDLATLLFHPKVTIPEVARERLIQAYRDELSKYEVVESDHFESYFTGFVLLQFLHRFGAYGRFGIGAGKKYFAESIPRAVRGLDELLKQRVIPCELPELSKILQDMVHHPRFQQEGDPRDLCAKPTILQIKIGSFAYKNGVPELGDQEVSRGGFVFDCRSLPNPGREDMYKKKTGRDAEVCSYLEASGDVSEFYSHVAALVDSAVKNYLSRGFTELVIAFGCTGGQHRSVYLSERLKRDLITKFPVKVSLVHRELVAQGYPVEAE